MNFDYLLIDKDHTLGEFWNDTDIYPNVPQFLEQQHNTEKKIVIVTSAITTGAKENLKPVDQYIHRYLGREHFQEQEPFRKYKKFYSNPENNICELSLYGLRCD